MRAWQDLGQSKALAPTLELAKRAKELGVAIFFITGRPSTLRQATERGWTPPMKRAVRSSAMHAA